MALGMDQPFLLHQNFDDFDDFCVNARIWDIGCCSWSTFNFSFCG